MTVHYLTEAVPHVRLMQQLTDAIDGVVDVADSHVPSVKWGISWCAQTSQHPVESKHTMLTSSL